MKKHVLSILVIVSFLLFISVASADQFKNDPEVGTGTLTVKFTNGEIKQTNETFRYFEMGDGRISVLQKYFYVEGSSPIEYAYYQGEGQKGQAQYCIISNLEINDTSINRIPEGFKTGRFKISLGHTKMHIRSVEGIEEEPKDRAQPEKTKSHDRKTLTNVDGEPLKLAGIVDTNTHFCSA
jgi:hypothetical protein